MAAGQSKSNLFLGVNPMLSLRKTVLIMQCLLATSLILCPLPGRASRDMDRHVTSEMVPGANNGQGAENDDTAQTLDTLGSILSLRHQLEKELYRKKQLLKKAQNASEKEQIQHDIEQLNKQLTKSVNDFDRIASGVDVSLFQDQKPRKFDWREEITSLVRPALDEMKRMTARMRLRSRLNMETERYAKMLKEARAAVANLNALASKTTDAATRKELQKELQEWRNRVSQLDNALAISQMQLAQLEKEDKSLIERSNLSLRQFFKTRGLYIFLTIFAFVATLIVCSIVHKLMIRILPGYREEHLSLKLRIIDLAFRAVTVILAITSAFGVLYVAQDWVLLSIAIVFMLGLGWTARLAMPRMWNQGRLMLNLGAVREGERIVLDGVPWLVKKINIHSEFENPVLGVTRRIPIEKLLDMESRPFDRSERWFPCKKGDWVILSDGTRGKVVSQSHEMVELVMRGGARKSYITTDFLSLTPLNLSNTFRIKVTFGISYDLQEHATSRIPEILNEYVSARLSREGYMEQLKNLRVEFKQAGASSLDLVVIADFEGEMAPLYNRLRRAIQRWCVEAATINNWEIPFPQLTVHRA